MSEPEPSPRIRKRRHEWQNWTGTPADLSELAALALELVGKDGAASQLELKATAPAFDDTFTAPELIGEGLKAEDLPELTELVLQCEEANTNDDRRRIGVTFTPRRAIQPSSKTGTSDTPPSVSLLVSAGDRDWADLAAMRLEERLNQGARATPKVKKVLVGAMAACFALAFIGLVLSDEKPGLNAGEVAALVFGSVLLLLLILYLLLDAITPGLELLPEGRTTRWEQIKQRSNLGGRWLVDAVVKAGIGVVLTLLVQYIVD